MKCISRKVVQGVRAGVATAAIATLCVGWSANAAHAGAVVNSGPISIGIFDTGNLGFNPGTGPVGLSLAGVGDAITPGILAEGWGVSGNGIWGSADRDEGGIQNVTVDSFTSSATNATSSVHLTTLPDLQITQSYSPSAGAPTQLFEDVVTLKNNSANTINDVRYTRAMDWDIPPTIFNEFVTHGGLPAANLLYSDDNGFTVPNPLGPRSPIDPATVNTNFTDIGPHDQGSVFDFGFGALAPGASQTFSIFYGATHNEPDAYTALANVGAEVYSLGESSGRNAAGVPNWITGEPGTYIFAFKGVGGTPISPSDAPEPSSMALLGLGMAGIAAKRRNRKQNAI